MPTRISGGKLDADYGAPTSGGPPYDVYEATPTRAVGFPDRRRGVHVVPRAVLARSSQRAAPQVHRRNSPPIVVAAVVPATP